MKKLLTLLLSLWSLAGYGQDLISTKTVVIAPDVGKTGVAYTVQLNRNWTKYPPTTAGLNDWKKDIAKGTFNLMVVNNGCVIPAGTRPPLVAPTCSQGSAAPDWAGGIRYTFNPPLLKFEASGQVGMLSFSPLTGGGFPTTNPDNVPINADAQLNYGPNDEGNGAFDKQWQLNYTGTSLRITLYHALSSGTYSYNLTPVAGANKVLLTGSNSTPPPSSTVVSGGSPTLAGTFDYTPYSTSTYPSDLLVKQENDKVKLVLDLREGTGSNNGLAGAIQQIVDQNTGRNTLGVPRYRNGFCGDCGHAQDEDDLGSGINICEYRDPQPWSNSGKFLPIGDNPNESGSGNGNSSHLRTWGRSTVNGNTVDYTNIDPAQWDGDGLRLGDTFEKWVSLQQNLVKVWYRETYNRNSSQGGDNVQYERSQEAPCLYANGSLINWVFYDGDSPYTGGGTRTMSLADNTGMTSGATYVTENWAALIGADGRGIGMIFETPRTQFGQFNGKSNLADGSAFGRNYIAWYPRQILDKNIIWKHSTVFVVGTLAEIRAKAYDYTQARYKTTPEYRFNQAGRQDWTFKNATDPGYVTSRTSWPITFTKDDAQIYSPAGAWSGSNKHVYVRYRYPQSNRNNPALKLQWRRARQSDALTDNTSLWSQRFPDGSAVGDAYQKPVTLVANNQWQTADFDMSGKPEWKGIINEFWFTVDGQSAVNETIEIEWISGSSSGPAQNGSALLLLAAGGLLKRRKKQYGIRTSKPQSLTKKRQPRTVNAACS